MFHYELVWNAPLIVFFDSLLFIYHFRNFSVLWIWDKSVESEYWQMDAIIQLMHRFCGLKTLVSTQILIPSILYVHYCKLLILWICLILPKGHTTMIWSQPDSGSKSDSSESVNFLRRIGPQTNVMPKSFTLGGFSHSAVQFRAKIKVLLINSWEGLFL